MSSKLTTDSKSPNAHARRFRSPRQWIVPSAACVALLLIGIVALWISLQQESPDEQGTAHNGPAVREEIPQWPAEMQIAGGEATPLQAPPAAGEDTEPGNHEARDASRVAQPTLSGRLVDSAQRAVTGGQVYFIPSDSSLSGLVPRRIALGTQLSRFCNATSDADGRFSLPLTSELVRAASTGLGDWPTLVVLAEGFSSAAIEVAGLFELPRDVGEVVLERGVTAEGVVVANDQSWVQDAIVVPRIEPRPGGQVPPPVGPRITGLATFLSGATSADGRFSIPGLPLGSPVTLIAVHERYGTAELRIPTVQSATDVQDLSIAFDRAHELRVVVQNQQGESIEHAHVFATPHVATQSELQAARPAWLRIQDARVSAPEGALGNDGVFTIPGLARQSYDVLAEAEGYSAGLVKAASVDDAAPVRVVLDEEAAARIRVVDARKGNRIEAAVLSAWTYKSGGFLGSEAVAIPVQPLGGGEFLVHGISENKSEVWAQAAGYAARLANVPGAAPGARIEQDVELGPEGKIVGKLTDMAGNPLADAVVRATRKSQGASMSGCDTWFETKSSTAGLFELGGIGEGKWLMHAALPGRSAVTESIMVERDGETVEWNGVLCGSGSIRGVVKLSNGRLQPGSEVAASLVTSAPGLTSSGLNTWKSAVAGADGEFLFKDLAPGVWQIGGKNGVEVAVKEGEAKDIELIWPAPPTVVGRVIDRAGEPVNAVVVAFAMPGGLVGGAGRTSIDGTFEVTLNTPGEYAVQAFCMAPRAVTEPLTVACQVGITSRCDLQIGEYVLRGRCFTGVDEAGVKGARVVVERSGTHHFVLSVNTSGEKWMLWPVTNENGEFEISVTPGTYSVTAAADGFQPASISVNIPRGATPPRLSIPLVQK